MKIIKIAELLEEEIINIVIEGLEDRIIKTDFGFCLNNKKEQVYRTHFSISMDFIQDTPANVLRNNGSPGGAIEKRRMSDDKRVKLFATELLGFTKS